MSILGERARGKWVREREREREFEWQRESKSFWPKKIDQRSPEESRCREKLTEFPWKSTAAHHHSAAVIRHNTKVSTFVMYFVLHPEKLPARVSGNEKIVKIMPQFCYIYNKKKKILEQSNTWPTYKHTCDMHTYTHTQVHIHARAHTHTSRMHTCIYTQLSINSTFSLFSTFFFALSSSKDSHFTQKA